jgi:polyhydroxyalkanoate synthesis regulator protein
MSSFARQQEQMRRTMEQTIGGFGLPFPGTPFPNLEEMGKQNMAMMERAMQLFSPFRPPAAPSGTEQPGAAPGAASGRGEAQTIDSLRAEVESLKRQLAELRAAAGGKAKETP